jgi:hypothetical protein
MSIFNVERVFQTDIFLTICGNDTKRTEKYRKATQSRVIIPPVGKTARKNQEGTKKIKEGTKKIKDVLA